MTDTLVERLAKAHHAAVGRTFGGTRPNWDELLPRHRDKLVACMRLTMGEAREPGAYVIAAMFIVGIDQDPRDYWLAAIEAALLEKADAEG